MSKFFLSLIIFICVSIAGCAPKQKSNFKSTNSFSEENAKTLEKNKSPLANKNQAHTEINSSVREEMAIANISRSLKQQTQKGLLSHEVTQAILQQSKLFPEMLKACEVYNAYHVGFHKVYFLESGKYVIILQCNSIFVYAYFLYDPLSKELIKPIKLVLYDHKGSAITRTFEIGVPKFNPSTRELSVVRKCISRRSCGDTYLYLFKGDKFIIKQIRAAQIEENGAVRYKQVYPK